MKMKLLSAKNIYMALLFLYQVNGNLSAQTADEMKQQLEQEIQQKYQASAADYVEYGAYKKAYLKWLEFKQKGGVWGTSYNDISKKPIRNESMFIIADFTKIRTEERLFLFDVSNNPRLLKKTFVTHGRNTGGDFARYFSNVHESRKSSKGFYVTSFTYQSDIVGFALKMHGQNPGTNDQIFPRGIVFHKTYTENGATVSSGCLAVPVSVYKDWIANIKGGTLIYIHTSESASSEDISLEAAEFSRTNQAVSPQLQEVAASEYPTRYESTSMANYSSSSPSLGAQTGNNSVGLLGDTGIPFGLTSGSDNFNTQLPPEEEDISVNKVGVAPYHGEQRFEDCQHMADEKWDKVVEKTKSGEDPHDSFKSSWSDLYQKIQNSDDIEEWRAINMAQNHLAMTRECAAMAYVTEDSPLDDERVNMEQVEKSIDGAIECHYHSAESQDFKKCHQTIVEYDEILRKEKEMEKRQSEEYKKKGETVINTLGNATTGSKQMKALNSQATLTGEKENIAKEREEFQLKKATYLQQALSQFPTRNSLLEKCRSKYKRFNEGGLKQYNEFTKIFDRPVVPVPVLPDPCYNAIDRMKVKLVQNVKARNQMKQVIRAAGLKAMDYNEKKGIFKNQGNFLNRTSSNTGKSYFFNSSSNAYEQCNNNDSSCSKGKERIKNLSLSKGGLYSEGKGINGKKGAGNNYRGILDRWTSNGIYDEKRYNLMDLALKNPVRTNLAKMSNNVLEFKKYYHYRDNMGELEPYQKDSIKQFFEDIKKGKFVVSDQKNIVANLKAQDVDEQGRRRDVIYKKDGEVFEFDINKNPDNSIFKIISNRYNQKMLKLNKDF